MFSMRRLFTLSASLVISLGIFASPLTARATIQLPLHLSKDDRVQALRIIGLGLSNKILSDPYPLGGYAGFEAGLAYASIPTEDLDRIGSGIQPAQQPSAVATLSVGKGLYENIDAFMQFTPYTSENELSQFGGILRWGFYQAAYLPFSLSVLAYGNSTNLANRLTISSWGADLIGGVDVDNVSVFAGIGFVEANGVFTGGDVGLTASGGQENEYVSSAHSVIGGSLRFANVFLALQMDRYSQAIFSAKIGARF